MRAGWCLIGCCILCACPPPDSARDSGEVDSGVDSGAADGGTRVDGGTELIARLGPDVWADVGESIRFDASASQGAVQFEWTFGDGTPASRTAEPQTSHAYATPGRYRVVLRVFDRQGRNRSAVQLATVTWPAIGSFDTASTMEAIDGGVAVVVTDADQLSLIRQGPSGYQSQSIPTCDEPVSVARTPEGVAVACRSGVVAFHSTGSRVEYNLGVASVPESIVAHRSRLAVSLAGTNQVAVLDGVPPNVTEQRFSVPDPRGLAVTTDGGFLAARFRSLADGGLLTWVDGALSSTSLGIDPQVSSDTEIGGIPNLLSHLAVSPDGRTVAVSSLQANILEGGYVSPKPLTFETSLRAITSFVSTETRLEQFDRRKQWDNRGAAGAVAFSPRGDFLFVAMPANGLVERYDMLDDAPAGTLTEVGNDLRGLVLSSDGQTLFVDAQLSREVAVYDVSDARVLPSAPIARVKTVSTEPLSPEMLRGKRLFFDASDSRLTRDGYISCAHCHPDGDQDGIVWDFTARGEGLRNTISLLGRRGTGDGPVHWSANFDEIQDFEGDIRNAFGGTGLMSQADWMSGTTSRSLGDAKAGKSPDLDALALYVNSLSAIRPNPFREADGGFTAPALRGKSVFERTDVACASCHSGARLTDSHFVDAGLPLLHNVGTLTAASGQRLSGPLTGIDTPTLVGAFSSPPFLHDGSAATLMDVLRRNSSSLHGRTSMLTQAELGDLEAYLKSL